MSRARYGGYSNDRLTDVQRIDMVKNESTPSIIGINSRYRIDGILHLPE